MMSSILVRLLFPSWLPKNPTMFACNNIVIILADPNCITTYKTFSTNVTMSSAINKIAINFNISIIRYYTMLSDCVVPLIRVLS